MKIVNKLSIVAISLSALALTTSCGDPMDEITSIVYNRIFSPTSLEAKNITEESVKLEWSESSGADSYTIEIYDGDSLDFSGTPVMTLTGITEVPYTVTGLDYDTEYSARVRAVDADDESRNSNWSGVYFETSPKQLFNSIKTQDIADRSVTLSWEEGTEATVIEILDADGNSVVTYNLTADDLENATTTIEGLSPETNYTAKMYYNGRECGSKSFTTIVDLNGATVVKTSDDLKKAIEEAEDGAVLALYNGTYTIAGTDDDGNETITAATVSTNITIKGIYSTDRPTVKGRFQVTNGASLTLSQLIIDGSENATGDQLVNYKEAVETGPLTIESCEVSGFIKGICYVNVAATLESVTINNSIIHDIICEGGDFFDCRKGLIKTTTFSNSTFYNIAAERDFIRMDDASSNFSETPTINVTNCTIDNVCYNAKKRLLYVRFVGNVINWKNTIVSNTMAVWSNQSKTGVPTFSNNAYYAVKNLQTLDPPASQGGTGGNLFIDEAGSNLSACPYTNSTAGSGEYTLSGDYKGYGYGDPRWIE